MRKIQVIAMTTFRELIREKFFLVIVFVAIFLIALSVLLGELSFDESQKILADIGLTAVQVASLGIALFTGSYMISREIEKQTCLLMLSRPITRTQFLLGKFSGIVLLISLLNVTLPLALLALLNRWDLFPHMAEIILSVWLEALVVLALVFMFSVVLRPVLSVMVGVVAFLCGSWLEDMSYFAKKTHDTFFTAASEGIKWILPNFYRFNWKNYFFLEKGLPSADIGQLVLHYVPWIVMLLVISIVIFRRKDIV
jgi:Cu-processing system permease protein